MTIRSAFRALALASACATALCTPVPAQEAGPQPYPMPPAIPAPVDTAYPGTLKLSVDAGDTRRAIFRVRETIPVAGPGPLTLLYPKWLPGNHSPTGTLDKLAGLVIRAGQTKLAWTRDPVDVYAFHVDVPAGAKALDLEFQYVSPVTGNEGRIVMTPAMLNLEWNCVALYPAGYFTRDIPIDASVRLPAGWQYGTALEEKSAGGGVTSFKTVNFGVLVDSPLFAGRYFERVDLDPGGPAPVHMDIVADRPEALVITPAQLQAHRNLVQQAYKAFGSHHYDHYDFLLALSDEMSGIGLEHHRSSEDGTSPHYFKDWDWATASRDLLSHEYTHSWNGKFRRPADLWVPNFNVPMRDSLLWVYEGQTQYWGTVLAARSGLWSLQQGLDAMAADAATYDARIGRTWRPLEDTTNDPIIAMRRPIPWRSWQRSEDYYGEGELVWLDADTLIREKTDGRKSLDDFARLFFGIDNGSYDTVAYTFDDIVKALNAVVPYDWATFLHQRLDVTDPAPLDGLTRGGYRLVYTETPSEFTRSIERLRKASDFTYSLGLALDHFGTVIDVMWDGPAFNAGATVGATVMAVNGVAYDSDLLKDAITQAKTDSAPIELLLKRGDRFETLSIAYHGGLRYPHLERIAGTPARLDELLKPRE